MLLNKRAAPGRPIFLGTDPAETIACEVAEYSIYRYAARNLVRVEPISLHTLGSRYTRVTTTMPSGQLFDEASGAPMSTSHAIARFFVPWLCDYRGWALFVDGDILLRRNINDLFELAEDRYAVMCVQHPPLPQTGLKKTGHVQQPYPRKNWSSVLLFNCGHLANRALTRAVLNAWPGRELHAFGWLQDYQIGALPPMWNHLVGVEPPCPDAALVHYTLGTPNLPGHESDEFADEWFRAARIAGYRFPTAFHAEPA